MSCFPGSVINIGLIYQVYSFIYQVFFHQVNHQQPDTPTESDRLDADSSENACRSANPNRRHPISRFVDLASNYVKIAIEAMAIEIVDFPMKKGGSFHSYVKLPGGSLGVAFFRSFYDVFVWEK